MSHLVEVLDLGIHLGILLGILLAFHLAFHLEHLRQLDKLFA
jgi:hypothetical protein